MKKKIANENFIIKYDLKANREGWLIGKTHRQCTNCYNIFEVKSKTVALCNVCNSGRVKTQNCEVLMYRRAKNRAKEKGIEFSITPEDIHIPKECPILKIPLYRTTGRSGAFDNSPSLDRKDSSKGYTKENIWVVSQLANAMKSSADKNTLIKFSKWVMEKYSN